jgi:hypothetical protein
LYHRAGGCELLGRMTVDQLGPADQQILVRRTGPISVNRGHQVGPPFAETLSRQDADGTQSRGGAGLMGASKALAPRVFTRRL